MELRNKILTKSLIGTVLGMFVGIVIWMFYSPGAGGGRSLLLHVIASGLHGMIPVGATAVFDIESWGLTKQTSIHAIITLATFLCIDIPMKWWNPGLEMVIALIGYVIVYILIWLFNYLYWRHTIKEMNEQLTAWHVTEMTDKNNG